MKYLLSFILLMFMSGCAVKMNDLKPTTQTAYIKLEKDIYSESTLGLLEYRWVHGLRAGTYTLVGEDKDGFYYHNRGDVVIALSEENADLYLKSGEMKPYGQRNFPNAGPGGLWIPKNNKDKRCVYYLLNTVPATDSASAGGNIGMASTGGAAQGFIIGAVTTSVISEMVRGAIQRIELEGLSEKLADIKIVDTVM